METSFNPSQEKAVNHFKGPALVLAGPGSGKTLVIVHRIKNLIEKFNVKPENILVVTFSRAAALEMQERFFKLTENNRLESRVSFSTFHSFFFRILKLAYNYSSKNIITDNQKFSLLREAAESFSLEYDDEADFFKKIISEISCVKNNFTPLDDYESGSLPPNTFRHIYKNYETFLKQKNLIDFDDMIGLCFELLSKRPDILKFWQEKYPYILIDEFQDINSLQYKTIKLIAGDLKNIFVVGDDDQSIYGFRGANPGIMKTFLKDYPGAEKILLNINYRCQEEILKKALQVISVNTDRIDKKILANKKNQKSLLSFTKSNSGRDNVLDRIFSLTSYNAQNEEFDAISGMLLKLKSMDFNLNETAVLFRSTFDAVPLLQRLSKANIPFVVKETPRNIFTHFIALDLIAYIRCAKKINRKDLLRISNKPLRYISRAACEALPEKSMLEFYKDKPYMHDRILKFGYDLKQLKTLSPYAAIEYILNVIGYEDFLKRHTLENRIDYSEFEDLLAELLESAKPYRYAEEWFAFIDDFTQKLSTASDEKKDTYGVQIMTMHGSKGLEFDTVFIPCLNNDFIPHRKAYKKTEIMEERRLFYVAMTRAKNHLHLSYSKMIRHKRFSPSEFLDNFLN